MTEPRPNLIETFIGGVYELWPDKDKATPSETAAFVIRVVKSMEPVIFRAMDKLEQDEYILDLRGKQTEDGKPITGQLIALRLGVSRKHVFEAIKRHQLARRAALREAS